MFGTNSCISWMLSEIPTEIILNIYEVKKFWVTFSIGWYKYYFYWTSSFFNNKVWKLHASFVIILQRKQVEGEQGDQICRIYEEFSCLLRDFFFRRSSCLKFYIVINILVTHYRYAGILNLIHIYTYNPSNILIKQGINKLWKTCHPQRVITIITFGYLWNNSALQPSIYLHRHFRVPLSSFKDPTHYKCLSLESI